MSDAEERTNWYGVHSAVVTDDKDPEGRGRVKVRLPALGVPFETWARLATLTAGRTRGNWFVPDVDDEVLVAFEAGDPRHPYVIGALWTSDAPDRHEVTVEDTPGAIEIGDGQGNSIRLDAGGVTITSAAKVTVRASTVEISTALLTVDAGMSRFSGTVQAATLIANSVIASSYSPGAGNLM